MSDLDISVVDRRDDPFRHVILDSVFSPDAASRLLVWLEACTEWSLAKTDFYEQYEVHVDDVHLPEDVAFLATDHFRSRLAGEVSPLLGCNVTPEVGIIAHKLVPGQRIRVHNDLLEGGETHRLTVVLGNGFTSDSGGELVLFESEDTRSIRRILRPIHNTGIAFAISERSYHAVRPQMRGARYTLVFALNAAGHEST